jgi:hypothetical protein
VYKHLKVSIFELQWESIYGLQLSVERLACERIATQCNQQPWFTVTDLEVYIQNKSDYSTKVLLRLIIPSLQFIKM